MNEATDNSNGDPNQPASPLKEKLELEKVRLERSKLSLDVRLKKKELESHATKTWRVALSNPLILAIVGGSLTLVTSIITNFLAVIATRDADERKASQARESESRALQSELIKTFLKTPDSKTARDNLTFLIESGLIPDHEKRIKEYLASNIKTVPKLSEVAVPVSSYPACPKLEAGSVASTASQERLGISLHFATSRLDPSAYGGWEGPLAATISDANAMQRMATKLGYRTNSFTDALARSDCLLSALSASALRLKRGDTLMLTMSGHGGQILDNSGNEPDKKLETWVLFDKQVDSNALYSSLAKFAAGVTIFVIQDSSHAVALRPPKGGAPPEAQIFVLAGTRENQVAMEGANNGAFTTALLSTLRNGAYQGSYQKLISAIQDKMPATQVPQLYVYGPNTTQKETTPFSLGSVGAWPFPAK